jgi:tRNA(Leu) C34 or U34 (ribose-2'-O)-methylase TrmL
VTAVQQVGKRAPAVGVAPAVVLIDPKYPANVGAALRACSVFGLTQLWWTGDRVNLDPAKGERLPREERMKGYRDVEMAQFDRPLERFARVVPVCVEIARGSEPLNQFVHPVDAVYVFGPEDGSVPQVVKRLCHRFVTIPGRHCLNLAAAVNVVLYDRLFKSPWLVVMPDEHEARGPVFPFEG